MNTKKNKKQTPTTTTPTRRQSSNNVAAPHQEQPSISDIEHLEARFEKDLKREITNKYHVFITAAKDTRELTDLVRRQNNQVEIYEQTLERLKFGNGSESEQQQLRPSDAEEASSKDDTVQSEDFFSFYVGSPYSQLDVLIVQRRMEEATAEATRLIHSHQQEQQSSPPTPTSTTTTTTTSLDLRLDKLNRLVIHALEHVPLTDHVRQLNLIIMTSNLLRGTSGCNRLLVLRSQLIQKQLRDIAVASASTLTDHIGHTYVRNVCRTFTAVISQTSHDFHTAFDQGKSWTPILCAFITWIKRDCIDCLVRILTHGPFNSLVGTHQRHTEEMYCYPLYQAHSGTVKARTRTATKTNATNATNATVMEALQHGCGSSAYFNLTRFHVLIELIRLACYECSDISIDIGLPYSKCIQRKLLFNCLVPSVSDVAIGVVVLRVELPTTERQGLR